MMRHALLVAMLGAAGTTVLAAPPMAQTAPLQARAKSVELDQRTGATRYRGDVQIALGRLKVKADFVEIILREGQVSEVRGTGDPIIMRREADDTEPEIEVRAQRLEFRMASQQIELFEDISMRQSEDVLRAQTARYHLLTRRFEAKGDPDRNQRVLAVYQPRKPLDTKP